MFTLQILDRGQSFLHALDASPVRIGSDPVADLRLEEEGVQPEHARLEPAAAAVRLRAIGPVRVNGRDVAAVDLALGDRIEIGKAVLVVGRSVTRPVSADDVLAAAVPSRLARPPRGRRKAGWLPFAAAGLLLAVVGYFVSQGDDTVAIRNELAAVARLRDAGQLELAASAIAKLRGEWANATDDRLGQLDAEQGRLEAIQAEIARLTAQVLDPAVDRSHAEWTRELRGLEEGGQAHQRVAARRVRAGLRETLDRRPRPTVAAVPEAATPEPEARPASSPAAARTQSPAPVVPPPAAAEPPTTTQPPPEPPAAAVVATPAAVQEQASADGADRILAEANRLAARQMFGPALTLLQEAVAAAPDEAHARRLQAHGDELRADAMRHAHLLAAQARQSVRLGKPEEAVGLLRGAQPRFPAGAGAELLAQVLREAEDEVDEPPPARPAALQMLAKAAAHEDAPPSLVDLQGQLEAIRRAEDAGAFAVAARLLRETAERVQVRDAGFAARLVARAEAADLQAAWHECVAAALGSGRSLKATTREGRAVTLRRATDQGLWATAAADGGEQQLPWSQVSAFGLSLLVDQTAPTGRAAVGAAALFYGVGDRARAEALLARIWAADTTLKPLIDGVLANGRGEPVDARGYTLGRDGFVSARMAELQKDAQRLAGRLDPLLRDKPARDAVVAEAVGRGADETAALAAVLQREFDRQLARLETHALRKQLERLEAQRVLLDRARDEARALIYDEARYFYPYRPPAVSGERFAEYNRVQAEVDRLVAALRTVWKDDRLRVRVPATLRTDLERLDGLADVLVQLGPFDATRLAAVQWARALPAGDSIGVRDYCRTVAEREQHEEWLRVEAYNEIATKPLASAVREQLRVTNDYRAMFGHRPLAIVRAICDAAQGHAEEMTRLGYFAHMSPNEARRTPYDRMQLAGYPHGASENIALCDTASAAHNAWCHSSGHHRNLLDPNHHEVGIGADGRHWVQNFGSGRVYRDDPAWTAGDGKRAR
ncbi:MAG: hypothetical protein KF830_11170 [Planctomycetes bacterium]|nr:hypothetical protein [Planctomycetota bacterium]